MAKEFVVTVDDGACINCGICMDACPIRTLDMSRALGPGPEATFARSRPAQAGIHDWMMVVPVQVDHCNGCTICVRECPTEAISIRAVDERPQMEPRQGPILVEPRDAGDRWAPLAAYTRAAMNSQGPRDAHDPWGKGLRWRIAKRVAPWQVWRTWTKGTTSSDEASGKSRGDREGN